jgi:hypothetical protein
LEKDQHRADLVKIGVVEWGKNKSGRKPMWKTPSRFVEAVRAWAEGPQRQLDAIQLQIQNLNSEVQDCAELPVQFAAMTVQQESTKQSIGNLSETLDKLSETQNTLVKQLDSMIAAAVRQERHQQMQICMQWIAQIPVSAGPLISVILPTRDRREILPRALESLNQQAYGSWEALIVDDGSRDETSRYLKSLNDNRFRIFGCDGRGACAARNIALRHARGEIIAYLDDDNMMHPNWLKSVVWAFQQRPEIDVLYGGFIIDDMLRMDSKGRGELPTLFLQSYDYHAVAHANVADISCIAHRAKLSEAHFDESLREMGDWDLFLRLTRDKPPLALPAVACFYTTDAPNRLTLGPTHQADTIKVKENNRRS